MEKTVLDDSLLQNEGQSVDVRWGFTTDELSEFGNKGDLSPEELQTACDLLARVRPGYLPLPLFKEVTRIVVTPIVEVVPLRIVEGGVQILLSKRPADDPFWPNQFHTVGTVVRATDKKENGYGDALDRILKKELGVEGLNPVFVENHFSEVKRGSESAAVYYVEINEGQPKGDWYDAEHLPEELVNSQRGFIEKAVESFRKAKS